MNSERPGGAICPPDDPKLHHIGFVVSSIQESAESFIQALGASWDGKITFDPVQKVRVSFFLERGGGLHHLCYGVEDLDAHLAFCKSVGTIIIRPPVPAVAFDGRRIAWGVSKKKLLLEFLESGQTSQ
jgi:methylmalonyl-CoA/ethylmalonyl-CoA epimerase